MTPRTLIIGSRTSRLAMWQTKHIAQQLQDVWPGLTCVIRPFVTKGDKTLDKPLPEIGGKGLFTAELEHALRLGEIDIAVHSLKDLPVENPPSLTLGAVSNRTEVRDALVACDETWTLDTLPHGATVGTSSTRRKAQLLTQRPDLNVQSIRGNVETRIRKMREGQYDAIVLAMTGLERLGLSNQISHILSLDEMLPAPGQGALAVQCRADDDSTLSLLAAIDDTDVRTTITAERLFLHDVGGGCSAPIAAYATVEQEDIDLQVLVASLDGRHTFSASITGTDPAHLAHQLAQQVKHDAHPAILSAFPALRPLAGKQIVITRARHQADTFAQKLTALGATPLLIPTIQIDAIPNNGALKQALQRLATYDWIIFTSVNGVEHFMSQVADHGALANIPIAAVGTKTTQALAHYGISPTFVPDTFVGEAIASGLGDVTKQRILLPRAEQARPNLPTLLRAQSAIVDDIPIYRTVPAPLDESAINKLRHADAITFTSGSTVRNLVAALPRFALTPQPPEQLVACIGPVTAGVARELGFVPDVVAKEHTVEGLITALVEYYDDTVNETTHKTSPFES